MNKGVVAGIVVAILLVVVGAGVVLLQNLDEIVKGLMEDIGTEVTGTKVSVAEVSINLAEATGTVRGLSVANPPGFSANNLFEAGEISLKLDASSLSGPVYVINEILVDGVVVRAEQTGTSTNVQAMLDAMEASEGDGGGEAAGESAATEDVLLAVGKIDFQSGNIQFVSDTFGQQSVDLPDFRFSDLGSKDNGLTPEQLATEATDQLVSQVQVAVSDLIEDLVRQAAEKKLNEETGGKFGKLKSLFDKN